MALLENQVALITAAGGAIGAATALRLAAEGAAVGCADLDAGAAEATAARVRARGGVAVPIGANVLDAGDCRRMVGAVVERFGALHVLCNVVGYFGPKGGGPLDQIDLDAWQWMMDINLKSVFMVSREAIPAMLRCGGGAIVNLGTLAAVIGRGAGAYGASKSGVLSLTRAMASEYQQYGIRVNCVCPSATDTPMFWAVAKRPREEVQRDAQGLASPEQIADVFLFLASPLSERVTGHMLMADNGFSAFRQ
jgi:NAD(P)-dependent dehydrogenase (short-subunit alcohol dehydrogenase family)